MLDDFRQEADSASFFEEEQEDTFDYVAERPRPSLGGLLGMTPAQRFAIALMLLMMTCLLGTLCLLVTGKITPAFL